MYTFTERTHIHSVRARNEEKYYNYESYEERLKDLFNLAV